MNLVNVGISLALFLPALSSVASVDMLEGARTASDQELVETYAPVLYFHPVELFRPQTVEVMVNTAQLRQARSLWFDVNVVQKISVSDLLGFRDDSYSLDAWFGDQGSSDYKNYSAHRAYYEAVLSPDAGGPPIVAYAHVVRDEHSAQLTIQYWLFYYYNDAFNKHEGDWEMIEIVLNAAGEPEWVVMSQHHGGTRRPWSSVELEDGTHPATYVALGSHANYFVGDEAYPNGVTIGNAQFQIMDRTGSANRIIPEVILVPDRDDVEADPASWRGLEWLPFGGLWGELAPQSDFGGPLGPAFKGEQWERPYAWGMAQPLDTDSWYENRLRVEIQGPAATGARISMQMEDGSALGSAESLEGLFLLHTDPPTEAALRANVETVSQDPYDLVVSWPDPSASQVTHYRFLGVPPGQATVRLGRETTPSLEIPGGTGTIRPASSNSVAIQWDAPDFVWVAGILPVSDVVRGVTISLLAGVVPILLYAAGLYWFDRYEKEPIRLLAAALLWGAIPAVIVAVVVRIFFQLPPELLGPEAIEAVRVGLVSPLVEEALKGAAILFIARRYRHQFDNVLDGVIYGAIVGFGFAMTGNTVSYLGSFLLRGFAGLSETIFVEGVLYGLDHALYSAIFGAGLGYARLTRRRALRWVVPLATFALAVLTNAVHNLAIRNAVSLNIAAVIGTWAGVVLLLIVMIWSMRRQRRCLETELPGQIPDELYGTLLRPWAGTRELWKAIRSGGFSRWRKTRQLRQACAELAFKRMQARLFPNEPETAEQAEALRKCVGSLVLEVGSSQ